jgi:hypothetical protein
LVIEADVLTEARVNNLSAEFTEKDKTLVLTLGVLKLVIHKKFGVQTFSEQ